MTNSMRALLMGAAMTGFVAGANAMAQTTNGNQTPVAAHSGKKASKKKIEKHACKGQNSCKGNGGGATKGKNACKGQGDCRTDGKKPPKS